MRTLIATAALALSAGSSFAQPAATGSEVSRRALPTSGAKLDCVAGRVRHADQPGPARPRRLDELPGGKLYLSVLREVDGCQELVLVSEERGRATSRR